MDARCSGDLAGRMRDAVVHVDPASNVRNPQDDQEKGHQDERELHESLTARPVVADGVHPFTRMTTAPVVLEPAAFVTVSTIE